MPDCLFNEWYNSTRNWESINRMSDKMILNNRYRLEETIGSGGMAMVFRARDLTLERDVAIKLLRENYSKDKDFKERFRQEARAAANLSHPNIVTVHDFGYDAGSLYIVMEYVPGTDLKKIVQHKGRLIIDNAVDLIIQACAGIGYAHRAGLIHCDVKPQNLIITPENKLKVTDFGIARALATIQPEEKSEVVWGSPQYFSPEQASGYPPLPASDVYSLGIVFFEMITGRLPFQANSADELARMHREDPPPSLKKYNLTISPMLEQVILKVLSKEPSNRYRTADQLGRVLLTYRRQVYAANNRVTTDTKEDNIEPVSRIYHKNTIPQPIPGRIFVNPNESPANLNSPNTTHTMQKVATKDNIGVDWITIFLGLLSLLTVGGLIPFWMWIYFLFQ
jgi:serine/threonine protein kinase